MVVVIAEDEYETQRTLPRFAVRELGQKFRVTLVFGSDEQRNNVLEIQVRDLLEGELPMEKNLGRWFAVWNAPGL